MGLESRSTEWLINRATYLREKINALNAIISAIREMQAKYRDNFVFVEAAEAVIRTIESQINSVSISLAAIEKEIDRRTVHGKKTRAGSTGGGPQQ